MKATESVAADATCDGEASCNHKAKKTKITNRLQVIPIFPNLNLTQTF